MTKTVKILGKKVIPIWLAIVALVAAGAGAAAGTVLAGKVTGEVPVAVSQALLVEYPLWAVYGAADSHMPQQVARHYDWIHIPNRGLGVASDDNTAFQAAAELAVGDWASFRLPIKNASSNNLTAELTLNVPECLEVEVFAPTTVLTTGGGSNANLVSGIVRTGLNTWKVLVGADAEYLDPAKGAEIDVVISIDDNCQPGYFDINGTFKQIAY